MTVNFDGNEMNVAPVASVSEQFGAPGGIVGFNLNYVLQDC